MMRKREKACRASAKGLRQEYLSGIAGTERRLVWLEYGWGEVVVRYEHGCGQVYVK